jgi:hypothetical protein
MNWFERYGIPGLYFVLLVTILCCIIFGFPYCKDQRDIAIKAFVAALPASVPIGYILVIFSQALVYWDKISWWRVHHEAWENAKNDEDRHEDKEWWVEAHATILGRWRYFDKNNKLEAAKWLQEWFAKRFDVLAINSALIVATFIGWFLVMPGFLLLKLVSRAAANCNVVLGAIFFVVSVFVIIILCKSNCLLTKQARYVATEYYKVLRKEGDKTRTSSSHNHVS